ncbi:glycoside hydrolase family 127 protein, partial [Bacillus sp. SIMBA_069]
VAGSPGEEGTSFFYTNTLHQRVPGSTPSPDEQSPRAASSLRAPWFDVSCCPTNVARTFASLGAYVATSSADGLQLHQF